MSDGRASRTRASASQLTRAFVLLIVAVPANAEGYEAAVDATFDGQLYQVTNPFGQPVLRRRRYTETLTLRMHDLAGRGRPGEPELLAITRLRLDADQGVDPAETSPGNEERFVPGAESSRLDLMTAYVEGRNYARGHLGFRIGRQYVVDPLGFWSFDGGLVRLSTPIHLSFVGYGGAEQRGGLYMMSTSRFEADGVRRGAREGMPDEAWPAYLDEGRLAPAYGFGVESEGLDFLDASVVYRRVMNRDRVVAEPFPGASGGFAQAEGDRISTERLGIAAVSSLDDLGSARGNVVYDALLGTASEYRVALSAIVSRRVEVGAELDYFLPTFDGDSIWNSFSRSGTTTAVGRARWEPARGLSLVGSGGVRRFDASTESEVKDDGIAALLGHYRTLSLDLGTSLTGALGERGHLGVADVSFLRRFAGGRYEAGTRLTVADSRDVVAPDRDGAALTYVLSLAFLPALPARVGVEWEHSMSDRVGHRLRALVSLGVTVY